MTEDEGMVTVPHGKPEIRNPISNFWTAKKCLCSRPKCEKSIIQLRARTPEDKGIVKLDYEQKMKTSDKESTDRSERF